MYEQYHRYKSVLMILDVLISVLVFASMVELRPLLPGEIIDPDSVMPNSVIYVMQALLWHMVFALTGVYSTDRIFRFPNQLGRFTSAYILAVSVFAGLLFFSFRETSRLLVVYFSVTNYAVLVTVRYVLSVYVKLKRKEGRGAPTVIIGCLLYTSDAADE